MVGGGLKGEEFLALEEVKALEATVTVGTCGGY